MRDVQMLYDLLARCLIDCFEKERKTSVFVSLRDTEVIKCLHFKVTISGTLFRNLIISLLSYNT